MMQQNKKYILVIDDEETVRMAVGDVLEMFGIPVLTAENGLEGFQLFKNHHENIGLIILDMQMPVMDGKETLRWLRFINPQVPIILSSGYLGEGVDTRDLRVDGFLPKPYGINDMMSKINGMFVS
ncbi:MAG: response regulator [Ardenticatenaceae bacterium]|nr:response regulator [Ardenticatenaceae bacterium]